MDRHQLADYNIARSPSSGDLLLLANGPVLFKAVMSRAFPHQSFSRTFDDRNGRYSWGTYIKHAGADEERALIDFCGLLKESWLLEDDLTETIALSLHYETSPTGNPQRTVVGQLVYEAKSYNRHSLQGNQEKATELANRMASLAERHPTFRRADLVVPVPGSNRDKAYDLPEFLCQVVDKQLTIPAMPSAISKVRETKPMKDCQTLQDKIDNVEGVFSADPSVIRGKAVLLVDDIYRTGFSINAVGKALQLAGARMVLGLVATKTMKDLGENTPW